MSDKVSRSHAGRVAIVTGGARGLGEVMTLALAKAGAKVLIVGRDRAALEECRQIANLKGETRVFAADLTEDGAPQATVDEALAHFGRLDILINNAGTTIELIRRQNGEPPPTYENIRPNEFRHVMDVNTVSPFFMSRAAIPAMRNNGWGRIVNITTSLDTMWRKGLIPYGGSKAANEANCVALAEELAGSGITVNVLTPGGPADTRMIAASGPRDKLIPPGKMIAPMLWLTGSESDGVTAQRFIAARWDETAPVAVAARAAGAPAAWQSLGAQAVYPKDV
jgi:NAD(P)-dependent dehydrogenase (short-subunit alcohol dehydrogenase family)